MLAETINVALIGSKFMGRAHSNAYLAAGRFFDLPLLPVMHTVAARDRDYLTSFAPRWGWRNWTADWRLAVDNPQIGLIDVATPNHLHLDQAIAALEAGKHVACEKPLASDLDQARQMFAAAGKAKACKTFVWFNYRRCPAVALAHQLVRQGRLGRIYHVRCTYLQDWGGPATPLLWRFDGKEAGSGALGDLAAHSIDMARFITGESIVEITGAVLETFIKERNLPAASSPTTDLAGSRRKGKKGKGRSTVDDAVLFLARFHGGAVASFEATRLATGDKNANRLEIHGEKGALAFNFERMAELDWFDATLEPRLQGWSTINVSRGADGHPYAGAYWPPGHGLGYAHTFINQVADMMLALAGKQPVVPLPDFADAYETQKVLHAVQLSAQHHAPVRLSEIK